MTAPGAPRVTLVGFTGTGKTTLAELLLRELRKVGCEARLVKLSAPLYRLQRIYYSEANVELAPGTQDQELMVEIASRLRKISSRTLLDQFLTTLSTLPRDVAVVNDDLRVPDPDAVGLLAAGFCVVKLECPDEVRRARLTGRNDQSVIDEPVILGPAMGMIPVGLVLNTFTATPAENVCHIIDYLKQTHQLVEG